MTYNYVTIDDIIERNEKNVAKYKIENYNCPESMSALISFDSGDKIRFYFNSECLDTVEWIKYKSFCGLIQTIDLEEKKCKIDNGKSATKTYLLINGKNYSTWIISSNEFLKEFISWECLTIDAELAEEEKIKKEQEKIEKEQEKFSFIWSEEQIDKRIKRLEQEEIDNKLEKKHLFLLKQSIQNKKRNALS